VFLAFSLYIQILQVLLDRVKNDLTAEQLTQYVMKLSTLVYCLLGRSFAFCVPTITQCKNIIIIACNVSFTPFRIADSAHGHVGADLYAVSLEG
jgi:hypothetical protein